MSEKRDLAIVGLLLGLLGGALILAAGLDIGRFTSITLDVIVSRAVDLVLGVGVLFGSVLLYRGRYSTGGILNLVLGIVAIILPTSFVGAILALISGVVGLLANEARR